MRPPGDYQKIRALVGWCLRNRRFQARRASPQSLYLNAGCGPKLAVGFVNLDYRWVPGVDVVWDLRRSLPFPDHRFRGVYSEHCVEHFDATALQELLGEFYRVLQPGGRLRLVVPSLEIHARAYVAALEQSIRAHRDGQDDTAARAINRVFYEGHERMRSTHWLHDGHHFIHDLASLGRQLRLAGFARVTRAACQVGVDPVLLIDQEDRRGESLYVEAVKPEGSGARP